MISNPSLRPVRVPMTSLATIFERRLAAGAFPRRLSRSLAIASGAFLFLYLVLLVLMPLVHRVIEPIRVAAPERMVTLIPEQLKIRPPAEEALKQMSVQEVPDPPAAAVEPDQPLPPVQARREVPRALDPEAARVGRERAQQATAALNQATAALDDALGDVASKLQASSAGFQPVRQSRRRVVRSGRGEGDLGAVGNGAAGRSGTADIGGSAVEGTQISIGTLAPPAGAGAAAEAAKGSGSAPGVYRSNASLLAVIRKYAAGIQYCYDTELKRDPGLRGKLVVALTVAASGRVTDVRVVQNTVGSERLASCALAQIRDWRFPPIAEGVTAFQTPFVFTPPN